MVAKGVETILESFFQGLLFQILGLKNFILHLKKLGLDFLMDAGRMQRRVGLKTLKR